MQGRQDSYHFKIGHFECSIIRDTLSPMKIDHFFPDLPDSYIQEMSRQFDIPPFEYFEVMCLLIKTGNHSVLVDTGCGIGTQPDNGKLIQNLQAERIKFQEVDRVIITHAHPDHIGGNIDLNGKSVFTRAMYFVFRKEWEFWESGTDLLKVDDSTKQTMIASAQKKLLPLKDQIELVDTDTEILPWY